MVSIFNVEKQLAFYGAYHSHPINLTIHIICVPLILWSAQVFLTQIPFSTFFGPLSDSTRNSVIIFNEYLIYKVTPATIVSVLYFLYYLILEPIAAILYLPQLTFSLLTATAFAETQANLSKAVFLHVFCWCMQFLGHGLAEKRAPALFDNLVGALVLAPLFVHLEILFKLGYRPDLRKMLRNDIAKDVVEYRKTVKKL
ncbi:hypothetical protein VKT23_007273 [Stygiomarasmius scandens]|uniref:DUF962 domain-containing protein n=1 Tax=Marasmiellus scandens TaxID=2682957 RepID=A0ABR1JKJ8_9AGAR